MKLLLLVGAAASVFCSTATQAAGVADCASFMKFGIFDQFDTLNEEQRFFQFKQWLRSYERSTLEQASADAKSAGIDVGIFSLSFGSANAQTNFSDWVKEVTNTTFETYQTHTLAKQKIRSISPALMKVVSDCITSQASGTQYSWIETSKDRTHLSFAIRYVPNGENDKAIVKTVEILPASLKKSCLAYANFVKNVTQLQVATRGFVCEIDPKVTVTVAVETTKGRERVTLDGFTSPPTPAPKPIIQKSSAYTIAQSSNKCRWFATLGPPNEFAADVYNVAPGTKATAVVRRKSNAAWGAGYPDKPETFVIDGKPHPFKATIQIVDAGELVVSVGDTEEVLADFSGSSECKNQELWFEGPPSLTLTPISTPTTEKPISKIPKKIRNYSWKD